MRIARACTYGCGVLVLALSVAGVASAVSVSPEIDGGSVVSGIGLLAASVMILRARMGSK